ncbi:hypothetical protein [Pseudooctadecabacter sp.]|uniref:hypothetical protein n=1 Tax=Pseudooctadecabacter sp. TaxID=1966338 RepID=UPI0035C7CD80
MFFAGLSPVIAALALIAGSAVLGILPVRKLIQVREAKHELKHGSAGFIRTTSGWIVIAIWLALTWFVATILGDWSVTGDLSGAIDRGWLRLQILLEILAALGDD